MTPLQVSCPKCGKLITVNMEPKPRSKYEGSVAHGLDWFKQTLVETFTETYSFTGSVDCKCGASILTSLYVSAYMEEDGR
jgi:hypothetical protein